MFFLINNFKFKRKSNLLINFIEYVQRNDRFRLYYSTMYFNEKLQELCTASANITTVAISIVIGTAKN